jgi:hypothetical protein
MVVAVSIFQFLRGDEALLQNVVNDRLRALGSDSLAQFHKLR